MRDDMHRVLIERPRQGHALANHEVRHDRMALRAARARSTFDDLPAAASMRPRLGPTKSLSDHLAPLRRFLVSRRGRPWDEVHAELREHLRPTSTIHLHVLQHLAHMVELHPRVEPDGRVLGAVGGRGELLRNGWTFYVDPETGRLAEPSRRRRKVRRARRLPHVLDCVQRDGRTWVRLASRTGAGWHEVRLARGDDGHDVLFDVPAAKLPDEARVAAYRDARAYAVRRRRVSGKRRRLLGLP